jgi:hypothetical protein
MEMPDFLQTKQPTNLSLRQRLFADKRIFSIAVLVVLLFAIPVTVWLIQRAQVFLPKAVAGPIELIAGGDCVLSVDPNKVSCATFSIKLTSPFEESESPLPTVSPGVSASPSPTSNPASPSPSDFVNPSASPTPSPSAIASASPSSSPAACSNLVKNGSFEGPVVTNPEKWMIFGATADLVAQNPQRATEQIVNDWNPRAGNIKYQVELQKSLFGEASSGIQYAEIDQPGVISLTQNISTEANKQYRIKFDYSPRSDRNTPQKMGIYWNDQQVGVIDGTSDGVNLDWQAKTFVVTATSTTGKLGFGALADSTPDAGNFIDNVSVTLVSEACGNISAAAPPTNNSKESNFTEKVYSSVTDKLNSFNLVPKVEAQFASACSNIVKNGGFENPAVASPLKWSAYGASADLVAADPQKATETIVADWLPRVTNSKFQVELQKSLFGPPPEGSQYAEIDQPGIISLNQNLTTEANKQYQVKFDYSPRTDRNVQQKLGVYWNDQQIGVIDGTSHGTSLDWQTKTFMVTANTASSKLGFGALADSASDVGNFIDNVSVTLISSACASPSPSTTASPSTLQTVKYRTSETEAGLASAEFKPYPSHPLITSFTFNDKNPGAKQIWVEFVNNTNQSRVEHISVELVEEGSVVTSLDCSMDISRQNLKLTLNGARLGTSGGKITVDSKEVQITSWGENQITAVTDPEGSLESGKQFKVVLTDKDGKAFPQIVCRVDTSLISLGARLFCREPGKFDVNGVRAVIVDENGSRVNEEVTIDTDGVIKGLKTKLQVGKPYTLSIKAPYSLRKNADFIAASGTNIITPRDDEAFILPVGDIAPVILADGKINTPDHAEIVRQWSVLGTSTKTADFNRDTKVNSIDWACMRFDFNKEDEKIPAKAAGGPGTSPLPSGVSPSSSPVISPLPSGQRAGYFLLEPLEGGSYPNGDEFIVNVNIWSQIEEANLFVAKLSFDRTALEVVRIEKGTTLTSWAEEFFDNQTGKISLVAGKPTPGLKTTEGNDALMAKIIFRAKKVGNIEIRVTNDSKIFSNRDNTNILKTLLSTQIAITN